MTASTPPRDHRREPHVCELVHASERALVRCHCRGADVTGIGPYAVVSGCGPRPRVRLFRSHASCGHALAVLAVKGCGRDCSGEHRLAVVTVGLSPAITWAEVEP